MISDPLLLLVGSFLLLFMLLFLGMKIAIALALTGTVGFLLHTGSAGFVSVIPFGSMNSFVLTAIPLFIFMGELLLNSGASDMIYSGTAKVFSWIPGGLLHSNIAACAGFAAISGSSPATAATIGTVAIPSLTKRGYDRRLILGSLAAGGTLGIMIPPSINMIVYGMASETSIGMLFAGGVIPGLLMAGLFMVYIAVRAIVTPSLAPKEAGFSLRSAVVGLLQVWPLLVILLVVLGGIFGGLMTPTEAAAIGSLAALIIAIALGRCTTRFLRTCLHNTVQTSAMVLFIIIGASILGGFFGRAGIPRFVAELVSNAGLSKWIVFAIVCVIFVFLGCFIDPVSIIVMTAATVIPLMDALGFDLIWFGVIYVVLAETGMITPPMGLNLFVIQGISGDELADVIRGSLPFFVIMCLMLVILSVFPSLVLWFPHLVLALP